MASYGKVCFMWKHVHRCHISLYSPVQLFNGAIQRCFLNHTTNDFTSIQEKKKEQGIS